MKSMKTGVSDIYLNPTWLYRKVALGIAFVFAGVNVSFAQQGGSEEDQTAQQIAPFDPTGYWVSVVSEDWRWRMVVAPTGDRASIPLNAEGVQVAEAWNPEADRAAGEECRAYGAAAIMRMPTRLHIEWEDDDTLRIETDHGEQVRRLHFAANPAESGTEPRSLQGVSRAAWESNVLVVETTNLSAGYLRRNGIPYSDATTVREFILQHSDYGDEWLTVNTIVRDPIFLAREFITSSSFKKLPNGSDWNPVECVSEWGPIR